MTEAKLEVNTLIEDCCSKARQEYEDKFTNDILALDSVNARESSQLVKALDAYRSCGIVELRLGAISSLLEALVLFEH